MNHGQWLVAFQMQRLGHQFGFKLTVAFSARPAQSVTAMLMPLSSLIRRREQPGILALVHMDVGLALKMNRVSYQRVKTCKDLTILV